MNKAQILESLKGTFEAHSLKIDNHGINKPRKYKNGVRVKLNSTTKSNKHLNAIRQRSGKYELLKAIENKGFETKVLGGCADWWISLQITIPE